MKKQVLIIALVFCFIGINATAQKAPNALTKIAMLKLSGSGIENSVAAKTYPVFFEYYAGKQQAEAAIISGESNLSLSEVKDRYIKNRDVALAKILSIEQMKLFKNKLEAELALAEKK